MNIIRNILFFVIVQCCSMSSFSFASVPDQRLVTYEFSGGRFGDNLMAYLHAKWISYLYHIPLLYKPFPYSSELLIDKFEIPYNQVNLKSFYQENLFDETFVNHNKKLYIVPYFPESQWERDSCKAGDGLPWRYFSVDWTDPDFRKLIKERISPKENLLLVEPPSDCINIAIHYRQGGGYDTGDFTLGFLTKFPSIDFYIQGFLKVVKLFQGQPLYCYFFTDARNPSEFIEKIKSIIPADTKVVFDFRVCDNFHDKNVLEDFFSLFNFDVLIHAESNFSLIPSLIHDYSVNYTILSAHLEGRKSFVDKVRFKVNEQKCLQRIKDIECMASFTSSANSSSIGAELSSTSKSVSLAPPLTSFLTGEVNEAEWINGN